MEGIHNSAGLIKRAAALVSASLVVISACNRGTAAETDAASPAAMTIGTENIAIVANGSLSSGPAISGALMPGREASVRAQVGGSVLQTYAEQGQTVRAGQVLARIDGADFRRPICRHARV